MLSLEEANAICAHAQTVSGAKAGHNRPSSFVPLPDTSSTSLRSSAASATAADGVEATIDDIAAVAPLSTKATKAAAQEVAVEGGSPDSRVPLVSVGLGQYPTSGGNLNDLLSKLFEESDKEGKVCINGACCGHAVVARTGGGMAREESLVSLRLSFLVSLSCGTYPE